MRVLAVLGSLLKMAFLTLALNSALFALPDNPRVELTETFSELRLDTSIAYYKDRTGKKTFNDILHKNFVTENAQSAIWRNSGYGSSSTWLRFIVANTTDEDMHIVLDSNSGHVSRLDLISSISS